MTDRKISELVAVTSVDDADEFVLARSGSSNKITGANMGLGGGSQSAVQLAAVHFSAAELQAISDPGTNVIDPPGSGLVIAPLALGFTWRFGTTPYTDGNVFFTFGSADAVIVTGSTTDTLNTVFTDAADTVVPLDHFALLTQRALPTDVEDLPLCIVAAAPLVGGDGTLSLSILYVVQTLDVA